MGLSAMQIFNSSLLLSNEGAFSDMGDLGGLMLGGFVLAIVLAIAITLIRMRLREKNSATPQFVSISSREEEK